MQDTLSLYFELESGEKADLEIVSTAAIAWVETLRATAQAIDPDADIRVEIVNADESSLIYNTIVEWFERHVEKKLKRLEKGGKKLPRTKRLALAFAIFVVTSGPQTYDFYFGEPDFTEEDRKLLEEIKEILQEDAAVETARQKFYRTIERDRSIKGVGIQTDRRSEPIFVVPRDYFPDGSGVWAIGESDDQERITETVLEVTLVKPALVHTPRAWTFKPDGLPEFVAVMKDAKVLNAIREKRFPEQLREGIRMTIRLQSKEKHIDGKWKLQRGGRTVTRVISPKVD